MSNLSDVKTKEVKINLGGGDRVLSIDFNCFAELEEIYGDVQTAMEELQKGSIKAIRAFVYSALSSDDETLTLKKVGKMLTMNCIEELSVALNEALGGALPKEDEETKN